ncbi:hypothetical protein F2P56_012410 [Juglans regia]|uniref:Endonuclease/exonuclease/phosphatase domain-containing protein n=2 Tax=Juglans regia TaxID=51240 RepID=A0A834CY61_JUGRE|nr:uncharacterized protein LOC109022269 [Juglans regia]KAF5468243.1 hypothetical protein F2P56_012410 [Juglans regia]
MSESIIVWNVRGIGTSSRRLKNLVFKFKPKLISVLEPFQNQNKVLRLMNSLHFDSCISNVDVGGKIWIFWDNVRDVQVVRTSLQFISLRVNTGSYQFLCNIVYAKCNMYERKVLWEDLSSHSLGSEPCLFAGDFNIIRNNSERNGGCPRPNAAMEDFNNWIHQGGLVEMKSKGKKYSWCNGQSGLVRSWEKLDRVFMDVPLPSSFPNAICSYLLRTTSDHSPMVIEFKMDPFSYGPSPFRFQQMWVDHPQFLQCIRQVWSATVVGQGLTKLAIKLKNTKVALREWNKQIFGHTTMHITALERHIEELENKLHINWDESTERDLLISAGELDIWLRHEDTRLVQMSKLKWQMEGDRNTKFFHACLANKRRKRVV